MANNSFSCNLDMKPNQSYSACPDEFSNASFLSNPTRLELLMSRAQTLVHGSNELNKNEYEMLAALKNTLLSSVDELVNTLEEEITKIQVLRCNTIKHAFEAIQERFHSMQPDENELKNFSSELQYFIDGINSSLDCVSNKKY
nr:uncharacterized protein LOC121130346 [Lepeophtheirus salmonis]